MAANVTTHAQWLQVNNGLIWFWLFLACVIFFATCTLFAHVFIPSLVSTRQLPQRTLNMRPLFYGLAIIALGAAIYSFAEIVTHLWVLYHIYGKIWI